MDGLRFSFHEFIVRLLADVRIHPCQVVPNGWRGIFCFMVLYLSVRSVVFVEGGLNTNCTSLSKFVWLVLIFKYETNLWRKYKRNKI